MTSWCGPSGGAVHAGEITAAVDEEAADPGNQAKLAVCKDAPRRHLFVVLTLSSADYALWALLSVLDGKIELPPEPILPDAITTVWASKPASLTRLTRLSKPFPLE